VFIRILGFKFEGKGDLLVIFDKFFNRVHMKANKYRKSDNIEYIKFEPMRVKATPGLIRHLNVTNLIGNDVNLKDIANSIINSNSEFIIKEVIPSFERNLGDTFTKMSNSIAEKFSYDELFPDL
jgi:Haemolymph juvenile hormone binding protein (JHBP)